MTSENDVIFLTEFFSNINTTKKPGDYGVFKFLWRREDGKYFMQRCSVENITGKLIELVKLTYDSGKHENTSQVTSDCVNISEKK